MTTYHVHNIYELVPKDSTYKTVRGLKKNLLAFREREAQRAELGEQLRLRVRYDLRADQFEIQVNLVDRYDTERTGESFGTSATPGYQMTRTREGLVGHRVKVTTEAIRARPNSDYEWGLTTRAPTIGDYIRTERFCTVRISAVFPTAHEARVAGFNEPTYTGNIFGKVLDGYHMLFAYVEEE